MFEHQYKKRIFRNMELRLGPSPSKDLRVLPWSLTYLRNCLDNYLNTRRCLNWLNSSRIRVLKVCFEHRNRVWVQYMPRPTIVNRKMMSFDYFYSLTFCLLTENSCTDDWTQNPNFAAELTELSASSSVHAYFYC